MPTIVTYNVNGIRAAMTKGFNEWLKATDPDVVCLQEVKAEQEQVDLKHLEEAGYHYYWHSAKKKGYSGVAILTKIKPDHVEVGCGIDKYDHEGRVLRADFGDISVMSVYMPSGSSGDERQAFKMQWLQDFQQYIDRLKSQRPNLVICGDYNICHQPIDIHNPKSNANTSGFLPEEREWIDGFIKTGFVDSFRHLNKDPHHYTWWSFRANARAKNLGWRIDYGMISEHLAPKLKRSVILPQAKHSDHCPVLIDLDF